MKRFLRRGTTVLVGASVIALSAVIAAPAHADVTGSLSGYPHTAGGTVPEDRVVNVVVTGNSTVGRLTNASLTIGGTAVGSTQTFTCRNEGCSVSDGTISFNTTGWADGTYHMVATLTNSNGETGLAQNDIEIWNNRPNQCPPENSTPRSCSAPLSIGSDSTSEPPSPGPGTNPGGGGVKGANESSCKSPRLSMSLSQKPLRVSHGVPVLLKNRKYRFTGRLTCLINNKRKSASKGTRIEVRNIMGRKTVRKHSGKVGSGGKITLVLKYPSSRTIEFRFRNADGKTSKVRIKVRIAQRKR